MEIVREAAGLARCARGVFVPTMGALHDGHRALIAHAAKLARMGEPKRAVVVSIFVNPTQFNEASDYAAYPRTLEADAGACREAGADVVFAPEEREVYPEGRGAGVVRLPAVATEPRLEDAFRPGHFAGVCQVVKRLFELVRPSAAVFGEKDWQQLAVVRAMVRELAMGIEIVGRPTVRERDGLAMSSRNARLTPNHRRRAAALFRALEEARRYQDAAEAERMGRLVLLANRIVPEYFVVRDAETLGPVREGKAGRALVAARVGGVRLIDNEGWGGK
jgi:pantoate--beta-alanine ligase